MSHLKVAVRVRPLSEREKALKATDVISVENSHTLGITNLKVPEQNAGDSRERIRRFTFDYCFNANSTQNEIFEVIEKEVSMAVKKRYHSCVLAYGQSSTGKTHTMMGNLDEPGITPRLCSNIFAYLQDTVAAEEEPLDMKTCVSYLEIYNEKVHDLLDGTLNIKTLKVREHPKKGPYVQGLIQKPVQDSIDLIKWLNYGNSNRRVAATNSNPQSSRSHSVFTVTYLNGIKLHLIDLAGSERAGAKFPTSPRFREGANINKSLVALGNVISALAEQSTKYRYSRKRFIPYRDSILTWLLKDTLGGNSKTVMIATISPSNACYSETVNTLRFGQRAKQIVSHPVVNEDPKERLIRELRYEIVRLKELLVTSQGNIDVSRCLCSCGAQGNCIIEETCNDFSAKPESVSIKLHSLREDQLGSERYWNDFRNEDDEVDHEQEVPTIVDLNNAINSIRNECSNDSITPLPGAGGNIILIKDLQKDLMKKSKASAVPTTQARAAEPKSLAATNGKKRVLEKPVTKAPVSAIVKKPEKSLGGKTAEKLLVKTVAKPTNVKLADRVLPEKEIDLKETPKCDEGVEKDEALWAKIDNGDLILSPGDDPKLPEENLEPESRCVEDETLNALEGACKDIPWNSVNEGGLSLKSVVTHIINNILQSKNLEYSSQFVTNPTPVKDLNINGKDSGNGCTKTEELIPVMEVTSNIKAPKPKPPLRRTFSVEGKSMERKNSRIFGSQELDKLNKNKPTPGLRKNSMERSNSSLKSADLKKIPEQSVDVSQVEARVNSIRKEPQKVQEVTQRLYMKVKKKDVATDTCDLNKNRLANKEMKTLASLKLKEFTRRAITAYKKRNKETQTYEPPVRFKEIGTDSYDLPFALTEVKSVSVHTDNVDRTDASTSSMYSDPIYSLDHIESLKNLLNLHQPQSNVCTHSHAPLSPTQSEDCGVNSNSNSNKDSADECKQRPPTAPFSFTKYIQPQHVEISNPCTANPIYTSTVNINVSHNYINQSKAALDLDGKANVLFPTPDLISNHNSGDVGSVQNEESPAKVRYAATNVAEEPYGTNESLPAVISSDSCSASMIFTPDHDEKLTVDVANVFAPEVCLLKDFDPDFCKPLKAILPNEQKPNIVECSGDICEFSIRLQEPLLLKSIMKQSAESGDLDNENANISDSCDSIQYETNVDVKELPPSKKVRFPQNERVCTAMSNFMQEANELMSHLNLAADNLETKTQPQAYEFQINVNDVPKFVIPRRGRKKTKSFSKSRSKSSESPRRRSKLVDAETDCKEMDSYENKYNSLVLDSCARLEQRVRAAEQEKEKEKRNYDDSYLHRFPQPFSISADWHQKNQQQEYSSLESNPTHSDYGSLPRRRQRTASRSPSAYLRHLTNLRQQIVETSREELLNSNQFNI